MNKYQESLNLIIKNSCHKKITCKECDFEKYCNSIAKEKFDNLQELVDKETPKKILRTVNDNGEPFLPRGYGECPKCKTVVGCSDKYCRECGQRLE